MVEQLWEQYLSDKNPAVRQELIIHYMPLVKYIVNRFNVSVPRFLDKEDLFSSGLMGLIEAVDRFNPGNGVKFETYAGYRIKGSVMDQIRKSHWLPRSVFKKVQFLLKIIQNRDRSGEELSDEKLAEAAGMTINEFHEAMVDISNLSCVSLDQVLTGSGGDQVTAMELVESKDSPNPEQIFENKELQLILRKALQALDEKDKLILSLYYNEKLTLKEIGMVLHISESRVCQLHGRAVLRLRMQMERLGYF